MPDARQGLTLDLTRRDDEARAKGRSFRLASSNPMHTMVEVVRSKDCRLSQATFPGILPAVTPVVDKATGLCLACVSASAQPSRTRARPLGLLNLIAQWFSCYCPH